VETIRTCPHRPSIALARPCRRRLTATRAALSRAGLLLGGAGEVVRSAVVGSDGFVGFAVGVGSAAVGEVGWCGVTVGEPRGPVGEQCDEVGGEVVLVVAADVSRGERDAVWRAGVVQVGGAADMPGLRPVR